MRGLVIFKDKKCAVRTHLFGNLEYIKHDTDGVGIQFFYTHLFWLLDLKPEAWSLCWAFSTKGHQKKIVTTNSTV